MRLKLKLVALAFLSCAASQAVAEDLLDIYKEAFIKDPQILQSKAERDSAFAAIGEANAALLPQIDVTGSVSRTSSGIVKTTLVKSNNKTSAATINLSQALWRHSAWKSRSIAVKNAAMLDLQYNDALQDLIIRVCDAYFGVLSAKDTLNYQIANRNALRQQLDEATRRFEVGLIAETDAFEAQAAYDLSVAQVISAENTLINSYEEIRKLLGRDVRNLSELNESVFSPDRVDRTMAQVQEMAENNNLQLQASVVARDIAKDQIVLAQTGHEPTLDFVGSYTTSYIDYDIQASSQVTGNYREGTVGLNLNFPLFSGGATASQVEQAEHNYIAAAESLELAHRTVIANANNGFNNVSAAISSVRAYEQLVKSSQSALNATRAGYDVGTRTITDVLDATQTLYSALQNLSTSRYNYILYRLNLLYVQGDLSGEDLEAVNRGLKPNGNAQPPSTGPENMRELLIQQQQENQRVLEYRDGVPPQQQPNVMPQA